jgi:hypothetical protein
VTKYAVVKQLVVVVVALTLVACASPQGQVRSADGNAARLSPSEATQLVELGGSPCSMTTRAVQMQARHGRYNGVDGFDARTCPAAGGMGTRGRLSP